LNVLMLGPDIIVKGGISSVEKIILESSLLTENEINFIFLPTHRDLDKAGKLIFAGYALLKFFGLLLMNKIDLVYIHMSADASFFRKSIFVMVSKLYRKRIVLHMHSSEFDIFYEKSGKFIKKYIKFIYKKTDKLIVLTQKWGEVYKQFVASYKIIVIYNSVEVPGNNLYNPDNKFITFLGILGKRKGTYDLLDVIPDIIRDYPMVKFVLAGNGEIDRVNNIIQQKGLEANVVVPGWINQNQKDELLRKTIIYVLPSYYEGLPMSVLEAMSYGLPVITTQVGGMSEVISNGTEGILITPGDKEALRNSILSLLSNEEIRRSLSDNGYKKIKEFYNSEQFCEKLLEVFLSLG
jgi:glycosyltransferase involved in cell wall biosynthesis